MTHNEFLEYYSSDKYTRFQSPPIRLMNTNPIQGERSYGKNVFSLAYQIFLNIEAAHVIRYRVLLYVLDLKAVVLEQLNDKHVWNTHKNPNLFDITIQHCKELLADRAPEIEGILEKQQMLEKNVWKKYFPNIPEWWVRTVENVQKNEGLLHYKVAVLRFPLQDYVTENKYGEYLNPSASESDIITPSDITTLCNEVEKYWKEAHSSLKQLGGADE